MEVHQVKPEYTKIVAAIPHSVSEARCWDWKSKPRMKKALNRWTDWFTDELFGSETPGVAVVKAQVSRFECDVERQEGESERLCRFIRESGDEDTKNLVLGNAMHLSSTICAVPQCRRIGATASASWCEPDDEARRMNIFIP